MTAKNDSSPIKGCFFLRVLKGFTGFFFVMTLSHSLALCGSSEPSASNSRKLFKQADVVLEVIPLRARPMQRGLSVDAVESDPSRRAFAEAAVSFKIRRVLKGEWIKEKRGGPTRMEQVQEALNDKDLKKIFGLDLSDPDEEIQQSWLSIAVENPGKVFGIQDWESPEPVRLKVYLNQAGESKNSFVLIGVVPS